MQKGMECYVFFVKTGKEDTAGRYIHELFADRHEINCQLLVPKRKLVEYHSGVRNVVYRVMFPGYVFIYTDKIQKIYEILRENWHSVLYRLLNVDNYFQKVEKRELLPILNLINGDGVVDISTLFVNQGRVYIFDGPLVHYTGVITKVNPRKKRVRVLLDLLDRKTEVDVCAEYLLNMDGENFKNMVLMNKAVVDHVPNAVIDGRN